MWSPRCIPYEHTKVSSPPPFLLLSQPFSALPSHIYTIYRFWTGDWKGNLDVNQQCSEKRSKGYVHILFRVSLCIGHNVCKRMWPAPTKPGTSHMGLIWNIGHWNIKGENWSEGQIWGFGVFAIFDSCIFNRKYLCADLIVNVFDLNHAFSG